MGVRATSWLTRRGRGSGAPRRLALVSVVWLASLGAVSSASAASCAWNPVCPYQGVRVLGGTDAASLDGPLGVAVTPSGDVVAADNAKDSVREFTATGQLVRQIGTPGSGGQIIGVAVDPSSGEIWVADNLGTHGFAADGTPNATASGQSAYIEATGPFQTSAITESPSGNLYLFNGDTGSVFEFSPAGAFLTAWPALKVTPGFLLSVTMAVDAQGNVYVADGTVYKFSADGTPLGTLGVPGTTIAISGSVLYAAGGPGINSYDLSGALQWSFTVPDMVSRSASIDPASPFAVGPAGIVAATTASTIEEIGLDGTPIGSWGGLATDDFQSGYALGDSAGNVYISDAANDRVIRYDAEGDPPTVFADLTPYRGAGLSAFDADGNLVVAAGNDLVTLNPDGSVASAVGNSSTAPNGTPYAEIPSWVDHWASDSAGDIYVDGFRGGPGVPAGDVGELSPGGQLIRTIDVAEAWPDLNFPGPIAVDAQGRIYVATGAEIREFNPAGTMIAVWATSAPATALSVAANGDVYASMGATVTRYYDFLDPLPPVPPASASPFGQQVYAIIARVNATLKQPTQSSAHGVSTTITCTGSAGVSCAGVLALSARSRAHAAKAKLTLLGAKVFSIPVGHSASETVNLNRAARRLLASRAKLAATLTVRYWAAANSSTTITRKLVLHGHRRAARTARR